MKARDVMTRNPITIGTGHSVHHAARIMLENQISGIPVLDDDGIVVGMLTEGDLMRRTELCGSASSIDQQDENSLKSDDADVYVKRTSWRAVDCMSSTVISVSEDKETSYIAALMLANDVKRLPVMRGNQIVGIVSRSDLLGSIVTGAKCNTELSDIAIRRAVLARLHFDLGFSPGLVDASVSGGCVELTGKIGSEAQGEAARVAAESVSGVSKVTTKLLVTTIDSSSD